MVVPLYLYWRNILQALLLICIAVCSYEDDSSWDERKATLSTRRGDGDGDGDSDGDGDMDRWIDKSRPHFLHNHHTLNLSVQLDSTVHLHCRINGIKDQADSYILEFRLTGLDMLLVKPDRRQVSWYRKQGSEIHLITFGFQTYHNDDRFALVYAQPDDWQLRIQYIQRHDEGTYQCQVSSHPPLIRTIHIIVVEANIQILDERDVEVSEKFYRVGSTIELQCQVSEVPSSTSLHIAWYHHNRRLNYDDSRGGVSLKTVLLGSVAKSWLRVSNAVKADSGVYYCNVTDLTSTNITIHVLTDEYPAAIQRGSNTNYLSATFVIAILISIVTACFHPHR